MNDRVKKLHQNSLNAVPTISAERGLLVTEYYKDAGLKSEPMHRALAFMHIMANKKICILEDELIVGERGPAPKATPTYPEVTVHDMEDLHVLDSRPKIPYKVDDETRAAFKEEIIPFWTGNTLRELMMNEVTEEWRDAFAAGVFTEFMEQRAPGHTVLDDKIYRKGMLDFIVDIDASLSVIDPLNDPKSYDKKQQLEAMKITCQAIIVFAERHADELEKLAAIEGKPQRKAELEKMAAICRHVPANAPRTFHEALQYYWFIHVGVITELNPWDAFNPGHLDQHLLPFYRKGLANNSLTDEHARELLQCFWVKFNNQPAPPKVGVTAKESGTYTDFANINTGGLLKDGSSGVSEMTYILLDVIDEMRLLQPSSNIQVSRKSPDKFIKRAARIIRNGWGQPSVFNADSVVEELLRQGKTLEDARAGGTSGCVETGAFGKESYILTGYFNLVKVLELTLNNGFDPLTEKQISPKTGDPRDFEDLDELMLAYKEQLKYFIDVKIAGNHIIETLWARHLPAPFLSVLIDDCIANGEDYNRGGARYNTNYIQGVGIGTITDALSVLKHEVFAGKTSMDALLKAMKDDFKGHENLQQRVLNKVPRYGNDDDRADDLMREVFQLYFEAVNGRPTMRGGTYRINMLPTTSHVYFGEVCQATPDGRHSGKPLSEGISPVQAADRNGPTSVLKSAAKMDHVKTGGTLLNQKFTPSVLEGDEGLDHLVNLVRTYFRMDGHHIQFNVIKAETLRNAKKNPDAYRDLIVRVAGYSDYFCDLTEALQDEIIERTEHAGF